MNEYISIDDGFADAVNDLNSKMETLNKESIAKTEYMCRNLYEHMKQDIRDVYCSLNWIQKLLWRMLGLHKLWLNK